MVEQNPPDLDLADLEVRLVAAVVPTSPQVLEEIGQP